MPKRIFIVGCACAGHNIYRNTPSEGPNGGYEYIIDSWKMIKEDAEKFYPEIEIVSVNPVGLKGMFKDVYTQSYVDEHPELKNENIEIINEEGVCKSL